MRHGSVGAIGAVVSGGYLSQHNERPCGEREQVAWVFGVPGMAWNFGGYVEAGSLCDQGCAQKSGTWRCNRKDAPPLDSAQLPRRAKCSKEAQTLGSDCPYVEMDRKPVCRRRQSAGRAEDQQPDDRGSVAHSVVLHAAGQRVLR